MAGWIVSYADRIITGPVLTWMIENDISFLQDSNSPYALAGIIGSLLFTGYMLTQFPGGLLGDKYGHQSIIVISLCWAGIVTFISGLVSSLIGFVALRVLVGLGEGLYYSNDRAIINKVTPYEKRSLGMGVVITGLSIGITLGTLLTPYLIDLGTTYLNSNNAWRMPFFILGTATLVVGIIVYVYFRKEDPMLKITAPLFSVSKYSIVFLIAIMAIFYVADSFHMPSWMMAVIELILAFIMIGFAFHKRKDDLHSVLLNKNLMILYISAITLLWNLWFLSFWSVSIISNASDASFLNSALTAAFNAVAGIIGYPAGGLLADYCSKKKIGKKPLILTFTFFQFALVLSFGLYIMNGGQSLIVMGSLLFMSSLFFNAIQTISHAITGEMAPVGKFGLVFGMWNLIGEIGAVLSPVISGMLRDMTGDWTAAIMLDAGIIFASLTILFFLKEKRAAINTKTLSAG